VEAEAGYRRILERDPRHGEALSALARIVGPRDAEEGLALLSRWSSYEPANHAPWLVVAQLHAEAGRLELAGSAYKQAVARAPSDDTVLPLWGRFLSANARYEEAMQVWARLAELAPQSTEPKLRMARIHYVRDDLEAEPILRSLLAANPQDHDALRLLGMLWSRRRTT